MLKLGSRVRHIEKGYEGRIIIRRDHLAGFSNFVLEHKREDRVLGHDYYHTDVHEPEVKVLSKEDAIKVGEPEFDLGEHVTIAPEGVEGVVTTHVYSVSGCIEYEVAYHEHTRGVVRQLFEAPLLSKMQEVEAIAVGNQTGSMATGMRSA